MSTLHTEIAPVNPLLVSDDGKLRRIRDKKTGLTQSQARFAYLVVYGSEGIAGSARLAYAVAFGWIDDPSQFVNELDPHKRALAHDFGNRLLNKPKVKKVIERYQRDLCIETDQSRATWIARAVEMREQSMRDGKHQAAAKIHRDIGEALGHFTTKIEVSSVPRSGDILTQIAQLFKDNPGLMSLTMQQLRAVDIRKMLETHPEVVAESEPKPETWEEKVDGWNPGACP